MRQRWPPPAGCSANCANSSTRPTSWSPSRCPAQLRGAFFGPHAKQAYDLFFAAVSGASDRKAGHRQRPARPHHTASPPCSTPGTSRLGFHPHIHCLVPGAGLDAQRPARAGEELRSSWSICRTCKPPFASTYTACSRNTTGKSIPPSGTRIGACTFNPPAPALRPSNTWALTSPAPPSTTARIVNVTDHSVTFRWKNRAKDNRMRNYPQSRE